MTKLIEANFVEELKDSYIDYSLSVLLSRALPDVRDGLKPVQRRIMYSMYKLGLFSNSNYKKCASIVGEVLGKYHPHGDNPVYEALVRMAQDFVLNYPLIDGQGNFGSIDGDPPAAYRYTEAKLTKIGELMLEDIELNTVDFRSNFDDTTTEPIVLPSAFPNLLVNGSTGIAVGMVTNIPPHNLNEVIDACIAILENPNIPIKQILDIIKGPDFPTGGIVYTSKIIKSVYVTGKGTIKVEGKYRIENIQKKDYLVIYEIPYSVNKSKLIKEIAEAIKDKKLNDVVDVIDQSKNTDIRILLELKTPYNEEQIVNYLKNFTSYRTSFYCAFIAVDGHIPKQYSILELLKKYVEHRKEVVIRRTKTILEKLSNKAFLTKGLIKAIKNIDKLVKIVRNSEDYKKAVLNLVSELHVNHKQAEYILNLQLHRLTKLEVDKLLQDYNQTMQKIKELSEILDNQSKLIQVVKEELNEIKQKYGKQRKTVIAEKDTFKEIKIEKSQQEEELILVGFSNGYLYSYKANTKKDKIFANVSNYNYVTSIYRSSSKNKVIVFLSNGKYSLLDLNKLIDTSIFLPKVFKSEENTKAIKLISAKKLSKASYVLIITQKGMVKKVSVKEILEISRTSSYIKLEEGDEVIEIIPLSEDLTITTLTEMGYAFRTNTSQIPVLSKPAKGVKLASLKQNDNICITFSSPDLYQSQLLILTTNNNKIVSNSDIPQINRGKNLTENMRLISKNEKLRFTRSIGVFSQDKSKLNLVIKDNDFLLIRSLEAQPDYTFINYLGETDIEL
ncbi:MAG: DNA topoisomerase (ATP-hydrolyzing) [bacterium]